MQAAHALLEITKTYPDKFKIHPHICLCEVRDEKRLIHDMNKLQQAGVILAPFYEEDLDNQLTAIATIPIGSDKRHLFRNFQLLKLNKEVKI